MEEELKNIIETAIKDNDEELLRTEIERLENERNDFGRAMDTDNQDELMYLRVQLHENQEKITKLNETIELMALLNKKEDIEKEIEDYKSEFGVSEENIDLDVERISN